MSAGGAELAEFRTFVQRARQIAPGLADEAHLARLAEFVSTARSFAAAPLRERASLLAAFARTATAWCTPHDILRIAGRWYGEDAYTELLAWVLHPETHPASALQRQTAWLASLLPGEQASVAHVAFPTTQIVTDTGVPDLILNFSELTVVVEAKTGTLEHDAAGSGIPQTLAYPAAVRKTLGLPVAKRIVMVFLTPDRREAHNTQAVRTSYASFAMAMARVCDKIELPPDLRAAFATVFSHFWSLPLPGGGAALRGLLNRCEPVFNARGVTSEDDVLLSHMGDVIDIELLFRKGGLL